LSSPPILPPPQSSAVSSPHTVQEEDIKLSTANLKNNDFLKYSPKPNDPDNDVIIDDLLSSQDPVYWSLNTGSLGTFVSEDFFKSRD